MPVRHEGGGAVSPSEVISRFEKRIKELESDVDLRNEFIAHLKDSAKGFTEDLEASDDLIATFDGFYVSYDKVIQACGGGTYGNDPLELIGQLVNKCEELEQNVCDSCLEYEDDGTPRTAYGWNENREEGQHPCACISESGPYQVLQEENAALRDRLECFENAAQHVIKGNEQKSITMIRRGLNGLEILLGL